MDDHRAAAMEHYLGLTLPEVRLEQKTPETRPISGMFRDIIHASLSLGMRTFCIHPMIWPDSTTVSREYASFPSGM